MRPLNDNESFSKKNLNDNVNERPFIVGKKPHELRAYRTARSLVEKFNNPKSIRFYYNVALKLSESEIWLNYEKATTMPGIHNRAGYFTTMCINALAGRQAPVLSSTQ